jgi:acetyl esterase/lipase
MSRIHPDLARVARFLPDVPSTPGVVRALQWLTRNAPVGRPRRGVTHSSRVLSGGAAAPSVRVHVYQPEALARPAPALLWIHGGGYLIGSPQQDTSLTSYFAAELAITVVAVQYRLAPQNPYPAAVEDCYAALQWMHDEATSLGVARDRIAIGGASAGGGLTAALALLARDRDGVKPAFQLLTYPMLDDRTALRDDVDERDFRLWKQRNNRVGWRSYLAREPGAADVPIYAAAARAQSLAGLCPAWLGVGALDLFHDEDVAYARRLEADGVRCALSVIDGAFHGFDLVAPDAGVSQRFRQTQVDALRRALF